MFLLILNLWVGAPVEPVRMMDTKVKDVPVKMVQADLSKVRVGVILATGFPGGSESFSSMIARAKPLAAVNGAYFSTDNQLPIGDIVVDSKLVHSGRMGTAFTVDSKGKVDIQRVVRHKTMLWEGYHTVLACGPALVLEGSVDVRYEEEGFQNPRVTGKAQRMALGYTQEGKLMFVHIKKAVTFEEAANLMKSLGCFEAMNLDGGASLAMAYNGKIVQSPGRKLTNVIAVWSNP